MFQNILITILSDSDIEIVKKMCCKQYQDFGKEVSMPWKWIAYYSCHVTSHDDFKYDMYVLLEETTLPCDLKIIIEQMHKKKNISGS